MSVRIPRVVWNQGEADRLLERGVYTSRFATFWAAKKEQIARITGQAAVPDLYMFQTGGYARKQDNHWMVLDQIDCVREHGAILIGPNWQVPVSDASVHPGIIEHVQLYETANWCIFEHEAGRSWNLLPPVTVERIGDTITIPISVRGDEELTTVPGKYSAYGGDPTNLGLEVFGGGSITSATAIGGSITLQVTGTVTEVRHAHQRAAGIDYGLSTDANGKAYVAHRSLIRTTLTKSVSVGGANLTLERWVPSFSVAITQAPALSGGSLEVS